MTEALSRIVVEPQNTAADSVVVWMHGLGDSGQSFVPLVPHFGLPRTRFVFLNAPSIAVTINGGMVMPAWYDILTLDRDGVRERESDISESSTAITKVIDEQCASGIAAGRIIVAGFSQGGAMALHVGTRYPQTLGGVVVLSAYMLLADQWGNERADANLATPIFFGHGQHDPMVPMFLGKAAHDQVVADAPERCEWHDYPMGHELVMEEVAALATWLGARLP